MVAALQPVPNYAMPFIGNEEELLRLGLRFNPVWLKWFIDTLAQITDGSLIDHATLAGLQGGTVGQYYHLTSARYTTLTGTQSANTVFAGPATGPAAIAAFRTLALSELTGAAALTKVDDTNVTLTLGGTPATSLLAATSLTLGWTGLLASSRGGTGNGFTKFSGPAASEKTFTLPNANSTVAVLGTAQTFTAAQTFQNSGGVKILDTDSSHTLDFVAGSDLSSSRTVTFLTGDANTTVLPNAAGTYLPTLTNTTNLDGSTAYTCQYMRVGNVVTVSGKADVDPTAAGVATALGVSLPIASNFAALEQCAGTAANNAVAGEVAAVVADTTNDRARLLWVTSSAVDHAMYFTFTYLVV